MLPASRRFSTKLANESPDVDHHARGLQELGDGQKGRRKNQTHGAGISLVKHIDRADLVLDFSSRMLVRDLVATFEPGDVHAFGVHVLEGQVDPEGHIA